MDGTLVSSGAALVGALIGGGASLVVAAYTQRNQERLQRIAHETTKREAIYAEFMMNASDLLLRAYVRDQGKLALGKSELLAIGLINRMRLFASAEVVEEAEAVLKAIIEISLQPAMQLGELAREALSHRPDPDPFLSFCRVCRYDLDTVRRTMA
ncbi:hypothetical protein [Falsiroseomonas sp. HW251]|uniref:hypothetical protein n=1 Tax=Falsiroseomonas sp. HW251 TaxID=3390998 RepID=UPI003D31BFDB